MLSQRLDLKNEPLLSQQLLLLLAETRKLPPFCSRGCRDGTALQPFHREEQNSEDRFRVLAALSRRYSTAALSTHQLQDQEVKVTGMRGDRTAVSKPPGTEGWKSGPRTAKGENASAAHIGPSPNPVKICFSSLNRALKSY